ncbi:glycosyl transferase family A [Ochrobactrum sp. MYb29]|nr:glycosyl transferase family A [Ochrobactrum sp. MYb29]
MNNRSICISIATRNRPKMLSNLFSSLAILHVPENTTVAFMIIENNFQPTLREAVEGFRILIPEHEIHYIVETTIGISPARNRALEDAIERDFDFLVYVDDDEVVEPDWLKNLLAERDRLDLDLAGSPVRPKPFDENLTFLQKLIWSGIEHSSLKSERKCRLKCQSGQGDTIKIATGSWMGKLDFFRKTRLRFDTRLAITGGEDWHLWAQAKSLGAKTGWACDAIVYEAVPSSRLTLSYHYRRNRDHNVTLFRSRYFENPSRTLTKLPVTVAGRAFKLFITILCLPFRGGQGLVSVATALGGVVGLLTGCFGKSSLHYANTTGC